MTMRPEKKTSAKGGGKGGAQPALPGNSDKPVASDLAIGNIGKTPVIGVKAVADHLGYSMRTIHSWRVEFLDFPVASDGASCVWRTTEEDLDAWRDKHIDLFFCRKERLAAAEDYRRRQSARRRWS